jgi:hypothetical protein
MCGYRIKRWPRRSSRSPEPGPQRKVAAVDTSKSSAPAHPAEIEARLTKLEGRYAHELLPEEERLELRERMLRLRERVEETAAVRR